MEADSYLMYDKVNKKFDIASARKRYIFTCMLSIHREDQIILENIIQRKDKYISTTGKDDSESDCLDTDGPNGSDSEDDETDDRGLFHSFERRKSKNMEKVWKDKNTKFNEAYKNLEMLISGSAERQSVIAYIERKRIVILEGTDQYGRTLLHAAVEKANVEIIEILIKAGVNIDKKEGCGATPLCLAVISRHLPTITTLLKHHAQVEGDLFIHFPSPLQIAKAMGCQEVQQLLEQHMYDKNLDLKLWLEMQGGQGMQKKKAGNSETEIECDSKGDGNFMFQREKGLSLFVGDCGTTRIIRSTRNS